MVLTPVLRLGDHTRREQMCGPCMATVAASCERLCFPARCVMRQMRLWSQASANML
jgi:hypothetical protein